MHLLPYAALKVRLGLLLINFLPFSFQFSSFFKGEYHSFGLSKQLIAATHLVAVH